MRLVLRKLPVLAATLVVVSVLTFLLMSLLPGDPARQILGPDATEEAVDGLRAELRLDDPLPARYAAWLGDAVTGDLGRSPRTGQEVASAITERLPVTLQLGAMSIGIALVVAIPLGTLSAYRAGTRTDKAITVGTFGLLAVPNFMMAVLLILVFAETWGILPATGWVRFSQDPIASLRAALLPALSLAFAELAVYTRLLRSDMITSLQQDWIAAARARGFRPARIVFRHALRPSSFSLVTVVGVGVATVVSGSVVVETLFAIPGVGRLLVDAILQRDLVMVQGVALVTAAAFVVVNFVVDLVYSLLDPRIRRAPAA